MKQLFTTVLLAALTFFAMAQERRNPAFQLNGNFQVGIPLDDFRANLNKEAFGGGLLFVAHIGDSPVALGAELSLMGYESESARYSMRVAGFVRDYEARTSSNILLGHAVMRFQPALHFPIRPYLDGLVGVKNLFTSTSLTDTSLGEQIDSGTDLSDWAFSYGGALGLQIAFSKRADVMLDLRCAYLLGANARYLVRAPDPLGGFNYNDPIEAFEQKSSSTNLLLPQIGVTFRGLFTKTNSSATTPDYDFR
jgi:opacity protein-like surface antigen